MGHKAKIEALVLELEPKKVRTTLQLSWLPQMTLHPKNFLSLLSGFCILYCLALGSISYFPNGIFEDDAYFYFQIATNLINNGYPTLDGYEPTNGFHPLWLYILVAIGVPIKLIFGYQTSQGYTSAFLALSCCVVVLIAFLCRNTSVRVLIFVLAIFCGVGMEGLLGALFIVLIFRSLVRDRCPSIWVAALVATRWDLVIALLPIVITYKSTRNLRVLFAVVIGVVFTAAAHNYAAGEFYSVSSMIKASRALSELGWNKLVYNASSWGNAYRYTLLVILNIVIFRFLFVGSISTNDIKPLQILGLIISANSFAVAHSFVSDMRDWYFAPTLFPLAVLASNLIDNQIEKSVTLNDSIFYIMSALGVLMYGAYIAINLSDMRASKDFVNEVKTVIPRGTRIFSYDGSGYLAWSLSGWASVTNGDGLVNSFEYFHSTLKTKDLLSYLRKNHIVYYIRNQPGDPGCIGFGPCLKNEVYVEQSVSKSTRPFTSFKLYEIK